MIFRLASRLYVALLLSILLGTTHYFAFFSTLQAAPQPRSAASVALVQPSTDTYQDFDLPTHGTAWSTTTYGGDGTRMPELAEGGPADYGRFIRLAFAEPPASFTGISFDSTTQEAFEQVTIDFDFRITPGEGQADGFGFALINSSVPQYGTTGTIPQHSAEEPNFIASLGIGFDIFQNNEVVTDTNANHLSLHFDNAELAEYALPPTLTLASGQWTHARIDLRLGSNFHDVTVSLRAPNQPPVTVLHQVQVAGLVPYPARLHFAARTGGQTANHDLDNIHARFRNFDQPITQIANNFDDPKAGSPYQVGIHFSPIVPSFFANDEAGTDNALRLTSGEQPDVHNSINFVDLPASPPDQVLAEFDLRMTPGTGRADGMGVVLLNRAIYSSSLPAAPASGAEEPNFAGSLGIGFDIFRNAEGAGEGTNNHVSLHFNSQLLKEFDVTPIGDLANGKWLHAQLVLRPGGGDSDVSLLLSQEGRPDCVVIDRFKVAGFTPYIGQLRFAARTGGSAANQEIDNVAAHFANFSQPIFGLEKGCIRVEERNQSIQLTVVRSGNLNQPATVHFATQDESATAGVDYTHVAGSFTFQKGEISKTVSIPILADANNEGAESLLLLLSAGDDGGVVAGFARSKITIIDDDAPPQMGQWSESTPAEVVPIHATLLPTGKIIYWDRHDLTAKWVGYPRLWDPITGQITATAVLTYDIFCGGHALLSDGRLLVSGGHIADDVGEDQASIYNPFNDSWQRLPKMNGGRWYPSNLTLPSGDMLVMAGTVAPKQVNAIPQVWQVATQSWRTLSGGRQLEFPSYADYYPFLHVAPNGAVFNSGPQQIARYFDPSESGDWSDVAMNEEYYREYGSAVLYADGKVLMIGGSIRGGAPTASAQVIDLNSAQPTWRSVEAMHFARRHLNATLLADGKVLVTGGTSKALDDYTGGVYQAELWDPVSEKWSVLAPGSRYRGYHSTALLLPDGRVWVGGGGHPDPLNGEQANFELFSPPYLFKGNRPVISNVPTALRYGEQFTVTVAGNSRISMVNWLRPGSVTHAFNQNQRIAHLNFVQTGNLVRITVPAQAAQAPPGHYMLFVLDANGVPALGQMMQLLHNQAPQAEDDEFVTNQDTPLALTVLDNDLDPEGDLLQITSFAQPAHGSLGRIDRSLLYTPTLGFAGNDAFHYSVSDGKLIVSAQVTITVVPVAKGETKLFLPLVSR